MPERNYVTALLIVGVTAVLFSIEGCGGKEGCDLRHSGAVRDVSSVPPNVLQIKETEPGRFLVQEGLFLTEEQLLGFLSRQPESAVSSGVFLLCETKIGRGDETLANYCIKRNVDFYLQVPYSKLPYIKRNTIRLVIQRV